MLERLGEGDTACSSSLAVAEVDSYPAARSTDLGIIDHALVLRLVVRALG
jgi:hypothetical protein